MATRAAGRENCSTSSRHGEPNAGRWFGRWPNAPALLRGYLDLNRAMKRSHLDRRVNEWIARRPGMDRLRPLPGGTQRGRARTRAERDRHPAGPAGNGHGREDRRHCGVRPAGDRRAERGLQGAGRRAAYVRVQRRADRRGRGPRVPATADRRVQPRRRHPHTDDREERRMSTPYLVWAADVGGAGCGRCANTRLAPLCSRRDVAHRMSLPSPLVVRGTAHNAGWLKSSRPARARSTSSRAAAPGCRTRRRTGI